MKKHIINTLPLFLLLIWSYTAAQTVFYPEHSLPPDFGRQDPVQTRIDIISYDLEIKIRPDERRIEGLNRIKSVALETIQNDISLDLAGLTVDSVFVNNLQTQFNTANEKMLIYLPAPIQAGDTLSFRIYYGGNPQRGLYFPVNSYGDTVIYSHNEPYDARYWFPCIDHPADKADFALSVILPSDYKVLSNGVAVATEIIDGGWQRTRWRENFPIATYLVSVAAAKYEIENLIYVASGDSLLLQYYVYPQDRSRAENALQYTAAIIDFFSEYTAPYPFLPEKYAMCMVPFSQASAMENQTATTMRDLIMDNENIIAHELAHQWWGDALTPESFVDIWLNEGFASYFDVLFTGHKYGQSAFDKRMNEYRGNIFQDGSLAWPILDPPAEYLFGHAVYFKGAWVLHMLRNLVGDQVFRAITRQYYQQFRYQNVNTQDFIEVCEQESGRQLDQFFDQWLNYGGIPELSGRWEQAGEMVVLEITQTGNPVYQFDLDVKIKSIENDTSFIVPVSDLSEKINITFNGTVDWIILDPENKLLQTNNSPLYFLPQGTRLRKTFPNPFHDEITIEYQSDLPQEIRLVFYDLTGRKVDEIVRSNASSGIHQIAWSGRGRASGIYFCVLVFNGGTEVRKIILIK